MAAESTSMEVTSTFERVNRPTAVMAFEGRHTCGEYRVVQEYHIAHGTEVLQEDTRYYADGGLLRERSERWIINRDSDTVRFSGRPIEEFCRSRHLSNVRVGISHLVAWTDGFDDHGIENRRTSRHRREPISGD